MATEAENEGCGLAIVWLVGIYLAYWLTVNVIIPLILNYVLPSFYLLCGVGFVVGGGQSVVNYFTALKKNVGFEEAS